jgi:hypothetical protein
MYVRFIVPQRGRRGVDLGLFRHAKFNVEDSRVHEALREAIRIELDWFNANLPIPRRCVFLVKSRGRWLSDGVCWFLDDAREMIARSFTLASLLRECGLPAAKVATSRPGQILYRDAWQIVAKPEEGTPIAWS